MIKESQYLDFLNSLVLGDKHRCREIFVSLANEGCELEDIYINLIQRALYKIGRMWENGEISIAEEHIASNISEYLVDISLSYFETAPPCGRSIIITGIDKDFHDIGARMVTNLFELHGWSTRFLGGNTPKKDVLNMIKHLKPNLVGITYCMYINFLRFIEMLDEITSLFPDQKIIVGGQGLSYDENNSLAKYENVTATNSIEEIKKFILDTGY
ncbi:MAG: cobalamin-dependent protein [Ignavibacteriales bacterium]|jgi:methanogenic corrinoid protein MtbC1|nr:MAG: hypothetical protein F9K26_03900 [Ignavibacteriaceae bacterium]MBW7872579.1 cobalamin B12-binding domain-containing protein [Ignavibacteria bacterium]MCZ2141868.1 cobalamin-dependent protein [Ignavibacteriales bacterium]MBV6445035.1 hypothetical protein [Ignavibacteriaceae bacterium]MBZ0197473.1 cobalamin-dependent protein [Ignavibacteriaceae bacterium]